MARKSGREEREVIRPPRAVFADDLSYFESPKLLLESAKENLTQLELLCGAFTEGCSYEVVRKRDNKAGKELVKLRLQSRIPRKIRTLVSAVVIDSRHILDQAICDAALCLGRKSAKGVYFPFGSSADDLDNRIKQVCSGVDDSLCAYVRTLQPHYGGNDIIWALSRIAAPNKHQRILGVTLDSPNMILDSDGLFVQGPCEFPANEWNEYRNELTFARFPIGNRFEMNVIAKFQIIIGTADIVGGKPCIATLREFVTQTEMILFGIEQEAARILRCKGA